MRPVEFFSVVALAAAATGVLAADAEQGRLPYETYCGGCHYEKVHDRKSTIIDSIAALKVEIAKRAAQTGRRFTPAELDDIAEYLNRSHYRLEK